MNRGNVGWDTLKTASQKRLFFQIPVQLINRLNTAALLESVLNYPMLAEIFFFSSFQTGVDRLRINFPAFDSLMKRKDICETVLNTYLGMDIRIVDSLQNRYLIGQHMIKVSFLEMIIAQNPFSRLEEAEKRKYIKLLREKYLAKSALINNYGSMGLGTTAWTLGRLLPADKTSRRDFPDYFLSAGMPLSRENLDKLLFKVNEYIKP